MKDVEVVFFNCTTWNSLISYNIFVTPLEVVDIGPSSQGVWFHRRGCNFHASWFSIHDRLHLPKVLHVLTSQAKLVQRTSIPKVQASMASTTEYSPYVDWNLRYALFGTNNNRCMSLTPQRSFVTKRKMRLVDSYLIPLLSKRFKLLLSLDFRCHHGMKPLYCLL
jgi:hypothetical protein